MNHNKEKNGNLLTKSKETATRKKIDILLNSLGWVTDEDSPGCNVFTERAKTQAQNDKLLGNSPDYILYQSGTDTPIAIIETKRKGQSLNLALDDSIKKYATPLSVPLVFVTDGTLYKSWHNGVKKELSIDGQIVIELYSEKKLLRFVKEGADLSEVSIETKHTREELLKIFKWTDDLLRKEGLREGLERFTEFSNILFLKLISEMEEERTKNGEPRLLDDKYCWKSFEDLKDVTMLEYINGVILPYLVLTYNHSGDVFENQLRIKKPKTLKTIVEKISQLKLVDVDSDVKGDAFEYFLNNSVTIGNDLGEYFTPRHIVRLMVDLVNPQLGDKVYDPTCGTGGFIIEAFRHIKHSCKSTKENMTVLTEQTIFAGEITSTARIAKMNMILAGDGHTNIKQQDSLENPIENEYDVVLANIPYGQTTDFGNLYPFPSNQADCVFVQHILKSLKDDNGRAAVIVPEGFLFRAGADRKTREHLVKYHNLLAVISLPSGLFLPYTQSKTDIILFEKNPKVKTKKVWFFDLKSDGFELSMTRKPISENDIGEIVSRWDERLTLSGDDKSWVVDISEIEKNDFDLKISKYKRRVTYESSYPQVPFNLLMKENQENVTIKDDLQYNRITVKLHGNGVYLRDKPFGRDIKTKEQKRTRVDQFIVAEIDAKLGAFGVIPGDLGDSIVSSHYFLFDLDISKILPQYFDYMIRFGPYEDLIQPFVRGTTNYAAIRPADVLQLKMPLPPLEIQEAIIDRLMKQENILNNLTNTLDSLKIGFIEQVLFDSINGTVPTKISELLIKKSQYGMTQSVMPEAKGTPFIRITDIDFFGRIKYDVLPEVTASSVDIEKYKVNEGDLLFARTGATIGKCAAVEKTSRDTVFASYLIRFVVDKTKVDPKYMQYYLLSNKGQKEFSKEKKVAQPNINAEEISEIVVPLPSSLDVQRELVQKIEQKLTLIDSIEKNQLEIKNTISKIINDLFSPSV